MYESMTFEYILNRALTKVSDNMDKRQGSVIYDAIAPACAELAKMYIELDNIIKISFAQTSYGEYLDKRVWEMGVERHKATYAVRLGKFYNSNGGFIDIPISSRFSIDDLNYCTVSKVSTGQYKLKCETAGEKGNKLFGNLIPIEYIENLAKAQIADIITAGEDEESDIELIQRYREYVLNKAQDGNIAQYNKWCNEYSGIGAYKVTPLFNGANTVKVTICSSDGGISSNELIKEFQDYLDPDSEGLGNGIAPIGAIVTVETGKALNVKVNVKLSLYSGFNLDTVKNDIFENIKAYFKSITFVHDKIAYLKLVSVVAMVEGVDVIHKLTVNDKSEDIDINDDSVPIIEFNDLVVVI